MDPVVLTQKLIQCPSVTPQEAGCLDLIQSLLEEAGFTCWRLPFGEVDNLYARLGGNEPHFCFAGHIDVVPILSEDPWRHPPFAGVIEKNELLGRGVVDMKGAIGAFVSAALSYVTQTPNFEKKGTISLLLTSDEEGKAINGTRQVVKWLQERKEKIDLCLVGEPTNPHHVGEMVKIGRRGSLNAMVTVHGISGHVAYPHQAQNPIPLLLDYLDIIRRYVFDEGIAGFDPTHLEISTIDVGNPTSNVIPAQANASFNIRFNPSWTGEKLQGFLQDQAKALSDAIEVKVYISGEAFYGKAEPYQDLIVKTIHHVTGKHPLLSTTGGTSDARFIKNICPVIEFGLVNQTAHQANERISVSEIHLLKKCYEEILKEFFRN